MPPGPWLLPRASGSLRHRNWVAQGPLQRDIPSCLLGSGSTQWLPPWLDIAQGLLAWRQPDSLRAPSMCVGSASSQSASCPDRETQVTGTHSAFKHTASHTITVIPEHTATQAYLVSARGRPQAGARWAGLRRQSPPGLSQAQPLLAAPTPAPQLLSGAGHIYPQSSHLNVRELAQVGVHGQQRLVHQLLVVVHP